MKCLGAFVLWLLCMNASLGVDGAKRMYNASTAAVGECPEIVRIRALVSLLEGWSLCSGTIIAVNWAMTAAHCLWFDKLPEKLVLFMGSNRIGRDETKVIVYPVTKKNVIVFSNYDSNTLSNDIGLIKFPKVKLSPFIDIATLPPLTTHRKLTYVGKSVITAGWGTIGDTVDNKNLLRVSPMNVTTQEECRNKIGPGMFKSQMCLISLNGASPCPGDSGGPTLLDLSTRELVASRRRRQLIGVTSAISNKGCEKGLPWIAQNVGYFLEKIKYVTGISY